MSKAPRRMVDWDVGLQITPPKPGSQLPESRLVKYEDDRVIAYLDDQLKPVAPERATFARIWTKDGVKLVSREPVA